MAGYRTPARILHWLIALAILLTIPAGAIMTTEGLQRSLQDTLFIFHKNIGVLILVLMMLRLVYRAISPPPPLPDSVQGLQRRAAQVSHAMLYVLVFFMAITGYVRVVAGGFPLEGPDALGLPRLAPRSDIIAEVAKTLHFYGRYVLIAFLAMHLGAALLHAVWFRDGVFSRMWPPVKRS